MKKRLIFVAAMFAAFFIYMCFGASGISIDAGSRGNYKNENIRIYSNSEWKSDLNYVDKMFPKWNPDLFKKVDRDTFHNSIISLKKELPELSDSDIKLRLTQIIASLNDGHSKVILDNINLYPLHMKWFGDDLRVISVDERYSEILGYKLMAVDGMPIQDIIRKVNTLVPAETEQMLRYYNVMNIANPDVLKFFNIIESDEAQFEFMDDNDNIVNIKLCPSCYSEWNVISMEDNIKNVPKEEPYTEKSNNAKPYWYKYVPQDKILYFRYAECIDKETAMSKNQPNYNDYPEFNDFKRELINALLTNDVDKFIIDMRENPGGYAHLLRGFLSEIKWNSKWQKINTRGKLFVLIDRGSFSAAVQNSLDLRRSTNAIFIGEPTGEGVNIFGDPVISVLPNTKIRVVHSSVEVFVSEMYKGSFTPDIMLEQSFHKYANGIDEIYEAAKDYK